MSTPINPVQAFETALIAKLKARTSLTTLLGGSKIYNHQAYDNPTSPWVIVQHQVGTTRHTLPSKPWENMLYFVKAVVAGLGQVETASAIFSEIDAELDGKVVTITGGTHLNISLSREGIQKFPDQQGYWHFGGFYRTLLVKV
jgi:hypothetical protein